MTQFFFSFSLFNRQYQSCFHLGKFIFIKRVNCLTLEKERERTILCFVATNRKTRANKTDILYGECCVLLLFKPENGLKLFLLVRARLIYIYTQFLHHTKTLFSCVIAWLSLNSAEHFFVLSDHITGTISWRRKCERIKIENEKKRAEEMRRKKGTKKCNEFQGA